MEYKNIPNIACAKIVVDNEAGILQYTNDKNSKTTVSTLSLGVSHIEFSNKKYEELRVSKMWDMCPKCNSTSNFKVMKTKGKLYTIERIECLECGHTKDISCPELA